MLEAAGDFAMGRHFCQTWPKFISSLSDDPHHDL